VPEQVENIDWLRQCSIHKHTKFLNDMGLRVKGREPKDQCQGNENTVAHQGIHRMFPVSTLSGRSLYVFFKLLTRTFSILILIERDLHSRKFGLRFVHTLDRDAHNQEDCEDKSSVKNRLHGYWYRWEAGLSKLAEAQGAVTTSLNEALAAALLPQTLSITSMRAPLSTGLAM